MARRIQRRSKWRDFRGTLRPAGAVIMGVAVAQAACGLVGGAVEWWTMPAAERELMDVVGLLASAAITGVLGFAIFFQGRQHARSNLTRREAVLAVVLIWLLAGLFGGIPFVISASMSPVDAFFESVSGLTTTGATVITDIDGEVVKGQAGRHGGLSAPVLLWRSLIQWLGGMGIVVLFVAVFPSVGAGAKHMFKGEVPGTTAEGLKPRIAETSFTLWKLYAGFTLLEAVLLFALGMSPFDSVCHAFTTMSTGGFSTRDASIGGFGSFPIEMVIATFMFLGSVNYGLYYALLRGRSWRAVFRNTELRAFGVMCVLLVTALSLGTFALHDHDLIQSFRYAYFMVGTTMSSTGYGTDAYMAYPQPALALVVFMMFVGGCSGSTAGGIKVERVVLMAKTSWAEFRESFRPAVVHVVRMGRSAVPQEILRDVAVFVGVYMACLGFGVLFVAITDGVPLGTGFGATVSCLSNMGPAPWHIESDNFAGYSDVSKVFFVLAMLLGRLEFFTLFALLVPDFWRR
ncbi:MAG TPA: TrkH family potassium uptake protein [Sandaracinaceae bacterium LLY-WYZ-13_1]|nr:TrkH family potassium uptake protein [Sandaracinaceae bacterium LLY-WYZ-13_1]